MNLILKNATYLFISNVILRLFSALTTIMVARYLGANDYGILSLALAISNIAGYFTDMGLSHTFIREATKSDVNDLGKLVGGHFKLRVIFVIAVSIVLYVVVELLYKDPYVKKTIYLMVYPTIVGGAMQGIGAVYFQALQQMHYTALIRAVSGLITATTLILGLIFKWHLLLLAGIYGFSSLLGGLFSFFLLLQRVSLLRGWETNLLNDLLSFTVGGLLIMILPQIPLIILEKVSDFKQVGYFSAAYRIPSMLYQVPGIVAAAFYPVLFKYGTNKEYDKHLRMTTIELKIMTLLGGCMVIPFLLYSDWWVNILFGLHWGEISSLLSIICIVVLLQSISYPLADSLTTKGQQKKRTLVMFIVSIVAVLSNYYLGEALHSLGSAIAVVITEFFLLIGLLLFNKKYGFLILWKGFIYNLVILLTVFFMGNLFKSYIDPLIGSILFVLIFISLVLVLDRELRLYLKSYKNE